MHSDYQIYFAEIERRLTEHGYQLLSVSDYVATFAVSSKWTIVFEGDPATRPSANFYIVFTEGGSSKYYLVRALAEIFADRFGAERRVPSFANQVSFIIEETRRLFLDPQPYRAEYDARDKLG